MIEIICFSINVNQLHVTGILCLVIAAAIVISGSLVGHIPGAFGFTGFIELVGHAVDRVCACCCYLRVRLEIMVLSINFVPAANQLTEFGVTICLHRLVIEQSGQLRLTFVDTVFSKVIVVAVD